MQALITQIAQTAACNRHHSTERWQRVDSELIAEVPDLLPAQRLRGGAVDATQSATARVRIGCTNARTDLHLSTLAALSPRQRACHEELCQPS
jgi:hypothetical protein